MDAAWNTIDQHMWERHTANAAMQQDWAYGAACTALGSRVLRAEVRDGRTPIALAQLVHRRIAGFLNAVVCTRGPVWLGNPPPDVRKQALQTLRRTLPLPRLRGLFITPDTANPSAMRAARMTQVMTPYVTATLDLTRPATDLRAAMHQKWRNRLAAAERAALTIRRIDRRPDHYRWLIEAEQAQQHARRYAALPPALVPRWAQAGGSVRVLTAEHGGAVVAAMVFLLHGKRATYHIGWSNPDGKRLSANNLLMWSAIGKLRRAGITDLDLGGLNTDDLPGIARFKLGTGAEVKTLCGTWFTT